MSITSTIQSANDTVADTLNKGLTSTKDWTDGFDISNNLKTKTQDINNSVSGFTRQAVNPIKSTLSDVKSGIALIKETDKKFVDKLYAYKSSTIDNINSYISSLTGGTLSLSDFGDVISVQDGFKVNQDALTRIAGKTMGFNINSITDAKNQLGNEFLNELNGLTVGLSGGIYQNSNGKITLNNNWDRNIGDTVFSFLGLSSSTFDTIRNFAAANSVLNVMVKHTAEIGYADGFKYYKDQYLYESDYEAALIASIRTLIDNGDVNSLYEVTGLISDRGKRVVNAKYPTFAQTLFSEFTFPYKTTSDKYAGLGEKMIGSIERIGRENWLTLPTFYGQAIDISLGANLSIDTQTALRYYIDVLSQKEETKPKANQLVSLLVSANFESIHPARDVFLRQFPNAVTF